MNCHPEVFFFLFIMLEQLNDAKSLKKSCHLGAIVSFQSRIVVIFMLTWGQFSLLINIIINKKRWRVYVKQASMC